MAGCSSMQLAGERVREAISSTDVRLIRYHTIENLRCLEEFCRRLYARNPKFEFDSRQRNRKINQIFHKGSSVEAHFSDHRSDELLSAAFASETKGDRVYLLCLGMAKSIRKAYKETESGLFLSGLQVELELVQRLHSNLSQVNWRLKSYRDDHGELLFLTNGVDGNDGYLNMGYEVLMTRILTRIEDDIYLLGGLPKKYLFDMSTFFLTMLI